MNTIQILYNHSGQIALGVEIMIFYFLTIKQLKKMVSAPMQGVLDKVKALEDKDAALIALVKGISGQITSNIDDKAALLALADDLDKETTTVAQAVTDYTPAAAPTEAAPAE